MSNPFPTEQLSEEALAESVPILKRAIAESHALLLYDNAIFLSERLFALDHSLESLYWVAQSYFLQGNFRYVCSLLQAHHPFSSRFASATATTLPKDFALWHWKIMHLWGVCCIKLNRFNLAEQVFTMQQQHQEQSQLVLPPAYTSAHHYFLGLVHRRTENLKSAVPELIESFTQNPLLFSAFEEVCAVGHGNNLDTATIFAAQNAQHLLANLAPSNPNSNQAGGVVILGALEVPCTPPPPEHPARSGGGGGCVVSTGGGGGEEKGDGSGDEPMEESSGGSAASLGPVSSFSTTLTGRSSMMGPPPMALSTTNTNVNTPKLAKKGASLTAPTRKVPRSSMAASGAGGGGGGGGGGVMTSAIPSLRPPMQPYPIQTRQRTGSKSGPSAPTAAAAAATPGRLLANPVAQSPATPEEMLLSTSQGLQGLMQCLMVMGEALRLICLYRCAQGLQVLQRIPRSQASTRWVLALLGRAHFELANYTEACEVFNVLQQRLPFHPDGMVEYSTALYHLKRPKELSALAQLMCEHDPTLPSTLAVLANCFSLNGDHDSAVKFLKRAIKASPFNCYTHTLLGHEHYERDEIDEALQAFRQAMQINNWHYNAWYGIGQVYMKQEQFALAQYYFQYALNINPTCSPLYLHLAATLQHQNRTEEAMENICKAIEIHPANLLARLKRAQLNLTLSKLEEARHELEAIRDKAPRELQVHLTLAKCFQGLGDHSKALSALHTALDLEPKSGAAIKKMIEQLMQNQPVDTTL